MKLRPADVRFYVDADILGLAHILAGLRTDVTYPGDPGATINKRARPACPVRSPRALDHEWIPIVAANRWVIITRDSNIKQHAAELEAVRKNSATLVAISGPHGRNTWEQLEVVMNQWRQIEGLHGLPGPLIFTVTRTSLVKVNL